MPRISLSIAFTLSLACSALANNDILTHALGRHSTVKSATDILAHDSARLLHFKGGLIMRRNVGGAIANQDVSYTAPVKVGTQMFNLIVDTGSSNTWVGADTTYTPSGTSKSTSGSFSVQYGSGSVSGTEYIDKVAFGTATVAKQSIGVASSSEGFDGVDGILGLGLVALTEDTVSNADTVPTFPDNLYSQHTISSEVFGLYLKPEYGSDYNDVNGEISFGGPNPARYSGTLTYVPRVNNGPLASYWSLALSATTYGSTPLGSASCLVDSGTTLIYLPTSAYNRFLSASGGRTDSNTGLVRFSKQPTATVTFTIGGKAFTLTPAQYLIPTAQYSYYGLQHGYYYAWINEGGSSGVNCILGQKFLENYYSVFDITNSRIGLAYRT